MTALARAQLRADEAAAAPPTSVELGRVFVAFAMLAVQGTRRLYECRFVLRPSKSPMLVPHWLLGIAFYTFMGLAVWIHGSGAILAAWTSGRPAIVVTPRVPSAVALFLMASLKQNECHCYLAGLKKYTLPSEGLFRHLVCPHYSCECVIYLAIAFVAAPPGSLFNPSVLCGLVFVAGNLGVTARTTKQWYARKFGADNVAGRWAMIPFVF
ncbi:hypothetical protein CDD83_7616 [Cordyceps sp. RAO-2017]|nr:hypothetical protein CDD83_7616 [Cordyceps sp. RAO-2017]